MRILNHLDRATVWMNSHKFVVALPFALAVFTVLMLATTSNTCAQGNCPVGSHGDCTLLPSGKIKCYCEGSGGGTGGPGETPVPGGGGGGGGSKNVNVTAAASCVYMPGGPTGFGNRNVMISSGRCKDDYYNIWIWYMDVCDWGTGACNVKMPIFIVECAQGCKGTVNNPKPPTPCTTFTFSGTSIECNLNWLARASATIPPTLVNYTPYPRGLNRDPLTFLATGLVTQSWQCSRSIDGWDPETWSANDDYQNFQFCLRWRQVAPPGPDESRNSPYGGYDPVPAWADWDWDERPWGNPKQSSSAGPLITHTYETSSADDEQGYGYQRKPHNGPDNRPSYQVKVTTYWMVEWYMKWQTRVCRKDPNEDPNNTCKGQPKMIEGWVSHEDGPNGLDLRMPGIGNGHYWTSSSSILVPDGRKMDVLPVPVIEVQGVQPK